jgi:formylglycine-generating enzyme required for sulfatase activity
VAPTPNATEPRVYLGYCTEDGEVAKRLAHALEHAHAIGVWLADLEVAPGDIVMSKLEEGIAQADVFLVLMSEQALRDGWMSQQSVAMLTDAVERERVVAIPVLVGGLGVDQLPGFLRTRKAVGIDDVPKIAWAIEKHRGKDLPAPAQPPPAQLDPVPEEELRRYFEKIESLYRELPLAGFETRVRVTIELDELYVPLDAVVDRSTKPEQVMRFEDERRHQVALAEAFDEARANGKRGVVLLGEPGSGKTTHLKQVLLKVVRDGAESIGLPKGTVPVFLTLRNLKDRTGGFSGFIEQELNDPLLTMAAGFGARLCERGRILFLLDGLDEVVDAHERAEVAKWIDHARRANASNLFLVSCRFAGYVDAVRLGDGFLELHLRPMSDEQARTFVRKWYRLVEHAGGGDAEQAELRAERGAAALIEVLEDRELSSVSRVYAMTHNPLLLTAICLVHRDRGELPNKRWLLYHEAVQVLLERWRKITNRLPVTFPADDARKVLQPVALWMHEKQGRTRASTEELVAPVTAALAGAGLGRVEARHFLRVIRDESGLLTGWGVDEFGFMHLGFQEYLAARAIRARAFDEPALLERVAGQFGESWWQEVILLMLAQDEPPLFERFMAAVLRQPEAVEWARSGLMARCLSEAEKVSAAPFVGVVRGDGRGRSWWGRAWRWVSGGPDAGVVARQVAALEVMGRAMPEALEGLGGLGEELAGHPAREVRAWWERWQRRSGGAVESIVAKRGGVELVLVPGGSFVMGSPAGEEGRYDHEDPQHEVELASFWLAKAPVTNAQYGEYLKANPAVKEPEYWGDQSYNQPQQPVVGVSWEEARAYCEWAGLKLPTEAQWEYACRAGTTTRYWSGDGEEDLKRVGWYAENSGGRLHAVGELEANPFGLYDMHGNVFEWCLDSFGPYTTRPRAGDGLRHEPVGDASRVFRGGSFGDTARYARSAYRLWDAPGFRWFVLGFRPAQVIP